MTCILIDDEPLAREGLAFLIRQIPALTLLGSFGNAQAARVFLATEPVDLLLLDINMPDVNGLDFARSLPDKPLLIFTTAYAQFALDSYELDAVDYLMKPIRLERLQKAIQKAEQMGRLFQQAESQIEAIAPDSLFIRADRRYYKLFFNDILFIKGLKDYVIVYTADQKLITAMNIKTISAQLPATQFARVSKSFLVNTAHIGSFDADFVYIGTEEIPIGLLYRDSFMEQYVGKKGLKR